MPTLAELTLRINSLEATVAKQRLDALSGSALNLTAVAAKLGLSLGAISLIKQSLQLAATYEQTAVAMESLLGNATQAHKILRELEQLADRTPFQFQDIAQSARLMLALGTAGEKILPTMKAVLNAAAALGGSPETMNRIVLALGQIQSKGRVQAEEMRQLAEAGIPAWEILATKIGVSIPTAMKMAERNMIDSRTALEALVEGINVKFGGATEKLSTTFVGRFSTFKDRVQRAMRDVGFAIIEGFNLNEVLRNANENMGSFATKIGDAAKVIAQLLSPIIRWFVEILPYLATFYLISKGVDVAVGSFTKLTGILRIIPQAFVAARMGSLGFADGLKAALLAGTALGVLIDQLRSKGSGLKISEYPKLMTDTLHNLANSKDSASTKFDDFLGNVGASFNIVGLGNSPEEQYKRMNQAQEAQDQQRFKRMQADIIARGNEALAQEQVLQDRLNEAAISGTMRTIAEQSKIELRGLDELHRAQLISTNDYLNKREAIEMQAVDDQIAQLIARWNASEKQINEARAARDAVGATPTTRATMQLRINEELKTEIELEKQHNDLLADKNKLLIEQRIRRVQALMEAAQASRQESEDMQRRNAVGVSVGRLDSASAIRSNLQTLEAYKIQITETSMRLRRMSELLNDPAFTAQANHNIQMLKDSYEELALTTYGTKEYFAAGIREGMQNPLQDFFESVIQGTATVKDAFKSMVQAMYAEVVRFISSVIVRRFLDAFASSGFFGAAGGGVAGMFGGGAAWGGVLRGGELHQFASGGVVSSPTYFPLRGGSWGLMGEAGTEGILPLRRDQSGRLGVTASGGGGKVVNVTMHVHAKDASSFKQSQRQIMNKFQQAMGS